MTNDEQNTIPRKVRNWPGMRTPGMRFSEFFLGFFPGWIGIIVISAVLLLPLIQSCREWARDDAEQAAPPNAADANP